MTNDQHAAAMQAALRQAFSLGQTYWQQADSDFVSQHKKSEVTRTKFVALVDQIGAQLLAERLALRAAGAQMSNLCFNLAQKPGYELTPHDCELMQKLQRDWDAA